MTTRKRYEFDAWAAEPDDWDQETGAPGIALFNSAVQVWSALQDRPTSVAEAALAFNVTPQRIVEAVERHYWMFLDGPADDFTQLMIEHEGE